MDDLTVFNFQLYDTKDFTMFTQIYGHSYLLKVISIVVINTF